MARAERHLLVAEYSGTARSGKGTIVRHLSESSPTITDDETGADYRAVTRALISAGELERGMVSSDVLEALGRISITELADIAADRRNLTARLGIDSLYEPDVQELVSLVAPVSEVRQAVKAGFKKRVEAVRDDDEHDLLLVDGRNLNAVIETIEGTQLLIRTFVSCLPIEAAWRECMRSGIDLSGDEGKKVLTAITERNANDAKRENDSVVPEPDAIEYWYDTPAFQAEIQRCAGESCAGDFALALELFFRQPAARFSQTTKVGAGALAARESRQIHFDTTYFRGAYSDPNAARHAMLDASEQMLHEALGVASTAEPTLTK